MLQLHMCLLGTFLSETGFACRLLKWEDTTPADSVAYAPSMELVGFEHLVQCSQKRQMLTIVSAINMFADSGPEKQELAFIHVSPAGTVPGQLDVAFLENLGFQDAASASQQHKVTTVLAINKPHVNLADAAGELLTLKSLQGKSFVQKGPVHYLVLQCGGSRLDLYTRESIQQVFSQRWKKSAVEPVVEEILATAPSSQCNHAEGMDDDEPSDEDMPDASLQSSLVRKASQLACHLHPYMIVAFKLQAKRKYSSNVAKAQLDTTASTSSMVSQEVPSGTGHGDSSEPERQASRPASGFGGGAQEASDTAEVSSSCSLLLRWCEGAPCASHTLIATIVLTI